MSDFKLSEDKLPYICEKLEIKEPNEKALVEDLCRDFCYFYHKVRVQHLSSIVAALEYHVRKSNNKKDFRIVIREMKESTSKHAVSFLNWGENGEYRYEIVIPTGLNDDIKLRNIVAHELSHLFLEINFSQGDGTAGLVKNNYLVDKLADVLGVFTILERTHFYKNKAPKMCHGKWEDIVDDFMQMSKTRKPLKNALKGTER